MEQQYDRVMKAFNRTNGYDPKDVIVEYNTLFNMRWPHEPNTGMINEISVVELYLVAALSLSDNREVPRLRAKLEEVNASS